MPNGIRRATAREPVRDLSTWIHPSDGRIAKSDRSGFRGARRSLQESSPSKDRVSVSRGEDSGFHFLEQQIVGDASISARLLAVSDGNDAAAAGLTIRADANAASEFVALTASREGAIGFAWGAEGDEAGRMRAYDKVGFPVWLRLVRIGGHVAAYRSDDGLVWELVDFSSVDLSETVSIGSIVSSGRIDLLTTALFDNMLVGASLPPSGGATSIPRLRIALKPALSGDQEARPTIDLFVSAPVDSMYRIEVADELGEWRSLDTLGVGGFGAVGYSDTAGPGQTTRFYRIVPE